jgi:hypothetical protein
LISKDVERVLLSMEKNLFQFGKSPIYLPQFRRKNTLSMNSTAQMWKRMKQCSPTPLLDLDLDRTSLSSTAHSSVLKKKKKKTNKKARPSVRPAARAMPASPASGGGGGGGFGAYSCKTAARTRASEWSPSPPSSAATARCSRPTS